MSVCCKCQVNHLPVLQQGQSQLQMSRCVSQQEYRCRRKYSIAPALLLSTSNASESGQLNLKCFALHLALLQDDGPHLLVLFNQERFIQVLTQQYLYTCKRSRCNITSSTEKHRTQGSSGATLFPDMDSAEHTNARKPETCRRVGYATDMRSNTLKARKCSKSS